MDRAQGRCAQKASAGRGIFSGILLGFRRMRGARRATGRSPLQGMDGEFPPGGVIIAFDFEKGNYYNSAGISEEEVIETFKS